MYLYREYTHSLLNKYIHSIVIIILCFPCPCVQDLHLVLILRTKTKTKTKSRRAPEVTTSTFSLSKQRRAANMAAKKPKWCQAFLWRHQLPRHLQTRDTTKFSVLYNEEVSLKSTSISDYPQVETLDQEALFQFVQRQVMRICAISLYNYLLFFLIQT